jgi:hypothetical protein
MTYAECHHTDSHSVVHFQYDNSSIRIFYDRGLTCQNASIYDDSFKILHDGSLDLNGSRLSYKSFCINFVETLEKGKKKSFFVLFVLQICILLQVQIKLFLQQVFKHWGEINGLLGPHSQ